MTSGAPQRIPMDLAAYEAGTRSMPCFICRIQTGDMPYPHQIVYDDGEHVAFLGRYPTMPGYLLLAPKRHVEHNTRDLDLDGYLRLQTALYRVARAVEEVVPSERTYLLSLGSQQGNSHIHWHIAPLPPGTPYDRQQYHALMAENGVIPWTIEQAEALGARLRDVLDRSRAE
jgi:diadenosine tetraphosphate (Ap4A) HIT family hydrolase